MSLEGAKSVPELDDDFTQKVEALYSLLSRAIRTEDIKDQLERARGELLNSWQASLASLAILVDDALQSQSGDWKLLGPLADASRDVAWRRPFGPSSETNDAAAEPKCILGVAVDAITREDAPSSVVENSLRLIANCCADEDENRRYVVKRSGLTRMLALPTLRDHADVVVPALYNVCIDFEDAFELEKDSSTDSSKTNVAENQLASAQGSGGWSSIETLLNLASVLQDDRKAFLAGLIEMASRPATQGVDYLHDITQETPRTENGLAIRTRLNPVLLSLSIAPGPQLAAHSAECCVSVCNALINMLSLQDSRKALLTLDLLLYLARLPLSYNELQEGVEDEDEDALEDLQRCRKAYLKLIYEITAMEEFQQRYTLDSCQMQLCVADLKSGGPLSTYLCVIMANLTTSLPTAEALVAVHEIHKAIILQLLQLNGIIGHPLPFVSLLVKLALPESNKNILVQSGAFDAFSHLLGVQPSADVQREAIVATRLLIKGQPDNVKLLREPSSTTETAEENGRLLSIILNLFAQTGDDSIKLEIGRLVIEVCRTVFKEEVSNEKFDGTFDGNPIAAKAVAFVACFGQGGAQSEGWFGLAMISIIPGGREMVICALEDEGLREEMRKVAKLKEGPSFENLRLMLTKLQPLKGQTPEKIMLEIGAASQDAGLALA